MGTSDPIPGCGTVTVEVTITSGACQSVTLSGGATECVPQTDCKVRIERTWSGIPAGSIVTGCVIQGGLRYCVDPPFSTAGGSSGAPVVIEYELECGAGSFQWSTVAQRASAPGGRISALAAGSCGSCPG